LSFEESFIDDEDILEGFGSKEVGNYRMRNEKSNNNEFYDNETKESQTNEQNKKKREFVTYKYSKMGKEDLHEAVLVNDLPFFIKYNPHSKEIKLLEKIEENSRVFRPPEREEYPYTPYEFETYNELVFFLEKAREITLDELYNKCKSSFFFRYVDQDEHIINLLTADSIWTYFQDLFPATHYSEGVGSNDVGKSSIGYTFEYTGYRVIKGTEISVANYNRVLSSNEPAQCTIIEDEGDSISEDSGKVRILKSGYEYNGKIPKINMNSKNQEQKWFKTFCYKMILAERSLSQSKAKGLIDRTFSFPCRPGKVNYSIKEVVCENIQKNLKLQRLYDELLNYRKLMLCYRLVHYKDSLVEIDTGLKNRDNELCKPLFQLFYGTNALKEIIKTLEVFVNQRKERKSNSIEAVLYPILKSILYQDQNNQKLVYFSDIWKTIIQGAIDGNYDEKKPNQYETVDYGTLYKNTLSKLIADKFGAKLNRKANGSILIFDLEKFRRFDELYDEIIICV
jgi:hypothetical protein